MMRPEFPKAPTRPVGVHGWEPSPGVNEALAALWLLVVIATLVYAIVVAQRDDLAAFRRSIIFWIAVEIIISSYLVMKVF